MDISSINTSSYQAMPNKDSFAKMKQSFDDLGTALQSGNLDDAAKALEQIKKNAPSGGGKDPMSSKIDALSTAIESGDLKAAQDAYAQIKKSAQQRPHGAGGPPPGGAPPGGAPKGGAASSGASGTSDSSSSTKVYDKKDVNKDGKVSAQEEVAYDLAHPDAGKVSGTTTDAASGTKNANGYYSWTA